MVQLFILAAIIRWIFGLVPVDIKAQFLSDMHLVLYCLYMHLQELYQKAYRTRDHLHSMLLPLIL